MIERHPSHPFAISLAAAWLLVAGCDEEAQLEPSASANVQAEAAVEAEAKAKTGAAVETKLEAKDFDLEAVAALVGEGKIESAAELEVIINDDKRGINHVDIDADGKIDHVQVVEVEGKAEGEVVFELRAVPSSSGSVDAAIVFATTVFVRHPEKSEVEIRTEFTVVVHQPHEEVVYVEVVPVRFESGVVVGGSVFLSWVFAVDRSVYIGVYTVDDHGHWIPPGHLKHGHWKAHGHGHSDTVVIGVHGGGGAIHFGSVGRGKHGGKPGKGGKGKGKWK